MVSNIPRYVPVPRRILPCCRVRSLCCLQLIWDNVLVSKFAQGSRIGILAAAVSRVCLSSSVLVHVEAKLVGVRGIYNSYVCRQSICRRQYTLDDSVLQQQQMMSINRSFTRDYRSRNSRWAQKQISPYLWRMAALTNINTAINLLCMHNRCLSWRTLPRLRRATAPAPACAWCAFERDFRVCTRFH